MTPERTQRRRGAARPPGARYIGRPTAWGNPYRIGQHRLFPELVISRDLALELFREYAAVRLRLEPRWLAPLVNVPALACYCPLDVPCHVDHVIELLDGYWRLGAPTSRALRPRITYTTAALAGAQVRVPVAR